MIDNISALDFNKIYTYADYLTWQMQERVELIKGRIFKMSPAPLRYHQEISLNLLRLFSNYLYRKSCKVFHAPFDVRLPKAQEAQSDDQVYTVVQPDIVVVCDRKKLDRRGCIGAPDLIVEILSPSTAAKDLKDKFALYEESGVREYWLIYPGESVLEVFKLDERGTYQLDRMYTREDTVRVGIFDDFNIDLCDVFGEDSQEEWSSKERRF